MTLVDTNVLLVSRPTTQDGRPGLCGSWMLPQSVARFVDYENKCNGTANLFMLFAPFEGWRHVKNTFGRD